MSRSRAILIAAGLVAVLAVLGTARMGARLIAGLGPAGVMAGERVAAVGLVLRALCGGVEVRVVAVLDVLAVVQAAQRRAGSNGGLQNER